MEKRKINRFCEVAALVLALAALLTRELLLRGKQRREEAAANADLYAMEEKTEEKDEVK